MNSICFILLLLISILFPTYGQGTCASGWVQNGGNCYLIRPLFNPGGTGPFGASVGTWDQCHAYCTTASYPGATMFCIKNATEEPDNAGVWIGYTSMPPYGGGSGTKQYGWVTGCSSTYTNWLQVGGIPIGKDYVYMYRGRWEDTSAETTNYCGCQYNPNALFTRPSTAPSSRPSTVPSLYLTAVPSSCPSTSASSDPTSAPSSGPTSSPTATPSFRPSIGDVSE